jgi:hypothetical protein
MRSVLNTTQPALKAKTAMGSMMIRIKARNQATAEAKRLGCLFMGLLSGKAVMSHG